MPGPTLRVFFFSREGEAVGHQVTNRLEGADLHPLARAWACPPTWGRVPGLSFRASCQGGRENLHLPLPDQDRGETTGYIVTRGCKEQTAPDRAALNWTPTNPRGHYAFDREHVVLLSGKDREDPG